MYETLDHDMSKDIELGTENTRRISTEKRIMLWIALVLAGLCTISAVIACGMVVYAALSVRADVQSVKLAIDEVRAFVSLARTDIGYATNDLDSISESFKEIVEGIELIILYCKQ